MIFSIDAQVGQLGHEPRAVGDHIHHPLSNEGRRRQAATASAISSTGGTVSQGFLHPMPERLPLESRGAFAQHLLPSHPNHPCTSGSAETSPEEARSLWKEFFQPSLQPVPLLRYPLRLQNFSPRSKLDPLHQTSWYPDLMHTKCKNNSVTKP